MARTIYFFAIAFSDNRVLQIRVGFLENKGSFRVLVLKSFGNYFFACNSYNYKQKTKQGTKFIQRWRTLESWPYWTITTLARVAYGSLLFRQSPSKQNEKGIFVLSNCFMENSTSSNLLRAYTNLKQFFERNSSFHAQSPRVQMNSVNHLNPCYTFKSYVVWKHFIAVYSIYCS